MKELTVIYEKSIKDKGRDSYLKAIKKQIPGARIIDVENIPNISMDKILVLKPMNDRDYENIKTFLSYNKACDIEGIGSGKLTITAEAIMRVIGDVKGRTVVIINQSNVLGIPLAKELIDQGGSVISLNSSYPCLDNLLTMTDVDILISASGQDEFEMDRELTRMIDIKVDLSDDLEDPIKITKVPTLEVLKERLEKWKQKGNY